MSNMAGTSVKPDQSEAVRRSGWPDPQEGFRLTHAFLNVREPSLRDAIVKLVAELSTVDDEKSGLRRIAEFALNPL